MGISERSAISTEEFSKNEIFELTKRVQVPGYELTRSLCDGLGLARPRAILGFYLQFEFGTMVAWAMREIATESM